MDFYQEPEPSRYDYYREAYGDPCPGCGTLRWQADCPVCYHDEYDRPEGDARYAVGCERHPHLAQSADAPCFECEAEADQAAEFLQQQEWFL